MPSFHWKDQHHTSIGIEPENLDVNYIYSREEVETLSRSGRLAVILGGGSNSLLGELDERAIVVKLSFDDIAVDHNSRTIRIGAGCSLDVLLRLAAENGLSGLETLAGIPGTIGGAIVQNAGAYGNEISVHVKEVECWDRLYKRWVILTQGQCKFANRDSIFLKNRERYLIYQAVFSPQPQAPTEEWLSGLALVEYVIQKRNNKFPDPARYPNSGSVLIHPYVPKYSAAYEKAISLGIPCHEGRNGCKIPMGAVLEKLGFKGKDFGNGIALSKQHANFLVRYGDAKLVDWLSAVRQMRHAVDESLGLAPEVEPTLLGTCPEGHPEIRCCPATAL